MKPETIKRITEIEDQRNAMWDENMRLVDEKEQLVYQELGEQCPFCEKGQLHVYNDIDPNDRKSWHIGCSDCGVQTPSTPTLYEAVVYWDAMLKVKQSLPPA